MATERKKGRSFNLSFLRTGFLFHFFITCIILVLVLFFADRIPYSYKKEFYVGNRAVLCITSLSAVFLFVSFNRWKSFKKFIETHSDKMISLFTKICFVLQIYFCYNAYFHTGWDAAVINNGASELAGNRFLSDTAYFSQFPNNLLLTCIFSFIKRIDRYIGVLDVREGLMGILCVQCLISSFTGYLLFKILRNLRGYGSAWCAWFCYLILTGTSGWLLIPYSDSFGLFLPVTILYLYQQMPHAKHAGWKWAATGALSAFGYCIKPQIFLVFIAIILVECFYRKQEKEELPCKRKFLYAFAGLFVALTFSQLLSMDIKKQLDQEQAFGITHYAMMGANPVNNGGYLYSDVMFSSSFATKSERSAANMEVFGQRLQDMGIPGTAMHCAKKLLTDYGDGTFAWEYEGNFFLTIYEPKNEALSPLLRNMVWGGGRLNLLYETIKQGVWLFILSASLGLLAYRSADNKVLLTIAWSMVILTLFELLFEARARYLYLYVPFYIIAGILGAAKIREVAGSIITPGITGKFNKNVRREI